MTILVSLDSRISIKAITSGDADWEIKEGRFLNCLLFVPIRPNQTRKVSIKVFSNGNLHMTGVKSTREALEWAERVSEFLGKRLSRVYRMASFNVQLINGCFGLSGDMDNTQLCLNTLQSLVPKEHPTVFQPDGHPGLRIKYMETSSSCQGSRKKASIIVFRSGKILINAFLSGRDLLDCYNFITGIIESNNQNVLKNKSVNQKFRKFDYAKYLD